MRSHEVTAAHLQWGHAHFLSTPAHGNLREVVHQPLEDVGRVQVTVVVHIDVHHTLGI